MIFESKIFKQKIYFYIFFEKFVYKTLKDMLSYCRKTKGYNNMINFIICEDIPFFSTQITRTVDKIATDLNLNYEKHIFKEYNSEFENIINSNLENKIYILDIVMPKKKGTEIAKMIRENDLDSLIIFITLYCDEYDQDLLTNDYMFLKFIDKANDYAFELYETLHKSLKKKRKQALTFETQDTFYRFDGNLVTHIYTDDRKSVICYGKNKRAKFNISLRNMKEELPDNFQYSKKSCIVNCNLIRNIDKANRIITFENGVTTDLLSKKYLKEILEKMKVKC